MNWKLSSSDFYNPSSRKLPPTVIPEFTPYRHPGIYEVNVRDPVFGSFSGCQGWVPDKSFGFSGMTHKDKSFGFSGMTYKNKSFGFSGMTYKNKSFGFSGMTHEDKSFGFSSMTWGGRFPG